MLQARVVGRYDDIDAALHDPDTFSSAPTVPDPPSPWRERFAGRVPTRGTLLGLDNPDHDRLRAAVNTFFMPRRLARYEPWIRERAYRLVDGFVKDGQTNLKTTFALPLALQLISHVVGLDADRWEWIGAALGFLLGPRDIHHPGTPEEKAQLLLDLHDHILEVMTERRRKLRVAVLREEDGRGGSLAVHDRVGVGNRLRIRGPRNHFRLRLASTLLFVAGGIGISPLLPMIEGAAHRGSDWHLLYLARGTERMAYLDELNARHGPRVEAWPSRDRGRFDLDRIWSRLPDRDAYLYACGPEPLLAALEGAARRAGREDQLVVERFAARPAAHGPNHAFNVVLARTGTVVTVAADDTVLDAVNRAGTGLLSTCREGTCGTCEVRVLDGVPEHRDSVLGLEERLVGETTMTCVFRCRGHRLTLDL